MTGAPASPVPGGGTAVRPAWPAIAAFVLLACGMAWLVALPLWLSPDGLASALTPVLLSAMMLTPTLAMLIVVFAFRVPRSGRLRFLGMWPLRPAGRFVGLMLAGLFGPMIVVAGVIAVAAAFGLVQLDLVSFSGFAEQLAAAVPAGTPMPAVGALVALQLLALPFGALINSFLAAGEELGWRGWLLPALLPLGTWPALLVSGAVWGLWHAPVILLGYNFARPDLGGLALMVGGCIAWGVLLGWLRLRSASVWPAVIAHGSLNAVAGLILILVAAGESIDMAIVGPLGVVAWLVIAAVTALLALAGQFRPARLHAPAQVAPRHPSSRRS